MNPLHPNRDLQNSVQTILSYNNVVTQPFKNQFNNQFAIFTRFTSTEVSQQAFRHHFTTIKPPLNYHFTIIPPSFQPKRWQCEERLVKVSKALQAKQMVHRASALSKVDHLELIGWGPVPDMINIYKMNYINRYWYIAVIKQMILIWWDMEVSIVIGIPKIVGFWWMMI